MYQPPANKGPELLNNYVGGTSSWGPTRWPGTLWRVIEFGW